MAIGVVEEMQAEAPRAELAQGVDRQARPEVAAADADIDHVGDVGRFQRGDQRRHARARLPRLRLRRTRRFATPEIRAQGRVQGGAMLRTIDRLAFEQRAQRRRHARFVRHADQGGMRRPVVTLPGEIAVKRADANGKIARPGIVGADQVGEAAFAQARRMRAERLPGRSDPHGLSGSGTTPV